MRILLCLLSIVGVFLLVPDVRAGDEAPKRTLTFVADDWCPYNCDPASDHPGYIIEILKAAFEPLGYKVVYAPVPWTRAIEEVAAGKYTGLVSTSITNTPNLVFPGVAQGAYGEHASSTFYVRVDDDWRYDGIKSLENRRLGMIADYLYGEEFDKYVADNAEDMNRIQTVAGSGTALISNVRKLIGGRIDVIVEDPFVMAWLLKQHPEFESKIKEAGNLGDGDEATYVAFSPNDPEADALAKILTEAMPTMSENGELAKILDRYGIAQFKLQETPKEFVYGGGGAVPAVPPPAPLPAEQE